jgi:ERF superfamily protein
MNSLPATSDYRSVIERAATDPNFDVDKLERLVAMQEASQLRNADQLFNEALARAEAEMSTISTNANNPQTKSRYATFARLDGEIRPIYTSHGFGIQFNTEPMGEPNMIRVVGWLSNGMIARRFQVDMPIVTQGLRGGDMMTRTHATMSAISYGKRQLEIMMFNLAIGDDDDGNRAGGYRPAPASAAAPRSMDELVDPHTGEVVDHVDPFQLELHEGQTWADFVEPMQRYLNHCKTIAEWDEWMMLNGEMLVKLKETKPQLFRLFEKNTQAKHEELTK